MLSDWLLLLIAAAAVELKSRSELTHIMCAGGNVSSIVTVQWQIQSNLIFFSLFAIMSKLVNYPVALPTEKIFPETDAVAIAREFLPSLTSLTASNFEQNGIWRDIYALTGTSRTFYGAASISAAWDETSKIIQPHSFSVIPSACRVLDTGGRASWLQAGFSFETAGVPKTKCSAIAALVPDGHGGWRIWCLRTILEQLEGHGNVDVLEPASSVKETVNKVVDGVATGVSNLMNGASGPTQFDCVVVGGGQAGLSVGGRLLALGLKYVILDKHNEVGDSWKTRYSSARLHTIREYAHLPFDRTFPDHYQEWLTKDDLAQGYKDWVAKFGINIWQKSKVQSGKWDPSRKSWTLNVLRNGQEQLLTCSQVILAGGGGSQVPRMPEYLNRDEFKGLVLHSAAYKNPNEWKGKRGVVIGTANTAHDIAEDMLESELSEITMIQRSKTCMKDQPDV